MESWLFFIIVFSIGVRCSPKSTTTTSALNKTENSLSTFADHRNINVSDADLFKIGAKHGSISYNLGDLLNMPTFIHHWTIWPKNHTSPKFRHAKWNAARLNDTILNYYMDAYDQTNFNVGDRYPMLINLYAAVRRYGEKIRLDNNLPSHFDDVRKNTTLLAHIRAGDKGEVDEKHIVQLVNLSRNFSKVIVMGGAHKTNKALRIVSIHNNAAQVTANEIHRIINRIDNATMIETLENSNEVTNHRQHKRHSTPHHNSQANNNLLSESQPQKSTKCEIHYGTNPDDDIYLMSVAANLMLHRGGYTAIGGLVCQGKVFFPKEMSDLYKSTEYMREIKHPVILF